MPTPLDPPRTLGIGPRQGPREVRFLVSEVPLYEDKIALGILLMLDGAGSPTALTLNSVPNVDLS